MNILQVLNITLSAALFSIIWIIQILHYPSFHHYEKDNFPLAMVFHQKRISWIVLPLMILELFTNIFLFILTKDFVQTLSLLLVLGVWTSTFFLQVPLHQKLLLHKDSALIDKLVNTNWPRTILWTIKLITILIFWKGYP